MIEKILKRFVSEECRVVIAAIEKIGTSKTTHAQDDAVDTMCAGICEYGAWADIYVLKRTVSRLDKEMQKHRTATMREAALIQSSELAAKILMGGRTEVELLGIPTQRTASVSRVYLPYAGMQGAAGNQMSNQIGNQLGNQNPYSSMGAQAYADSTRVSQGLII